MTAIAQVFQFEAGAIRTAVVAGTEWVVGKDVCEAVGISKYRDALAQLDEDERVSAAVDTPGGRQQMVLVNESGVYALLLISRSPKVKKFRKWVTGEVLPAIRKTGRYDIASDTNNPAIPQSFAEALQLAADQARELEQKNQHIAAIEPKADAWDVLADASGDYSVREAAYMLNRDPNITTGQNRLFKLLRDWRLIDRNGIPYADHARHVQLRAQMFWHERDQEYKTTNQVRVTADGLRYLHKRLGGAAPPAALTTTDQPALPTQRAAIEGAIR